MLQLKLRKTILVLSENNYHSSLWGNRKCIDEFWNFSGNENNETHLNAWKPSIQDRLNEVLPGYHRSQK